MKKVLGILVLCLCVSKVYGLGMQQAIVDSYDKEKRSLRVYLSTEGTGNYAAKRSSRTLNGLDIYIVTGDTLTVGTVEVLSGTITIRETVGSAISQSTYVVLADHTLDSLIDYIHAISTNILRVTPVVVLSAGQWGGNDAAQISAIGATTCLYSTNTLTLALDNTRGLQGTFAAVTGRSNGLKSLVTNNITFATGECFVYLYDGSSITVTSEMCVQEQTSSGVDARLYIPAAGLYGTVGNALIWTVVTDTWCTRGIVNYIRSVK